MTQENLYTISELADAANVTPRTVRYYTAEGLLPRPDTRGRYALYTDEHLNCLRLICKMKDALLPLGAIRAHLEQLDSSQVRRLVSGENLPVSHKQEDEVLEQTAQLLRVRSLMPVSSRSVALLEESVVEERVPDTETHRIPSANELLTPDSDASTQLWERITLTPGVELHLNLAQLPCTREQIERLIVDLQRSLKSLQ